jgi:PKD repeat protein
MSSTPAMADTAPAAGKPATVSADALPTIQINGVVWSQTMIGNIVYATGEFSTVRPPGVAAGGAGETAVSNIVAYDIRTGQQVTGFKASLNAQGMAITAAPDGSRLYVGGDFTAVNGQASNHIAALDPATGNLIASFAASISGRVRALSATPTTVFAGGEFPVANNTPRKRLAAFTSTGALLPWNPSADDGYVWSILALPDRGKVIVGGQMKTLSGSVVNGMAAVDITSGAVQPWAANTKIIDHTNGAIISLKYDGSQVYGSGFAFGTGGQFEGTFALNPDTGAINVVNDCHGDTYDVMPIGQVLYSVSHVHGCEYQGGFPSSNPWSINQHNQLAQTTYPVNKNTGPDDYGWNYGGLPSSENLHWYPDFIWGNYTPSGQASWSVTGNSDYIALGGEFRGVNGVLQQGLTRFAVKDKATNKQGPMVTSTTPTPTAKSVISGTARVSWQALADRDNTNLTYEVLRSGNATPVYTTTQASSFWQKPTMGYTDRGLTPGATYTYTIRVKDPLGNTATLTSNAVTISSTQVGAYAQDVVNDGASYYWRLGESSGPTLADSLGSADLKATSGLTYGQVGALNNDSNRAIRFSGFSAFAATQTAEPGPDLFSVEAWVKTTSSGKIVGFGNAKSGDSSSYDRHLYVDSSGYANFGVYNNGTYIARSTSRINDGQWHQLVGTLDSNGVSLYVDGVRVARNTGTTTAQPFNGYWRVGGDSAWSGNKYLPGTIDEVAVYPTSLTLSQIQDHYRASGRTLAGAPNVPPVASFTNTSQGLKLSVDGSGSTDEDGTIAAYSWNWGDGTAAGSGATATHTYAEAGTYTVTLTVTDDSGATNTTTRSVTVTNTAPTAAFTTDTNALALAVDGSGSSDPDGSIAAYSWNWGDGTAAGSGATATHTYAAAGTYTVTLTVTDNAGGTDTATKSVTVSRANQAPTAAFTADTTDLKVSVNGSGSSDPDGTVASYAWNWGDGTAAGSGATASHTYAAAGTYTVTLTVTDNDGATDTATKSVTVTAAQAQVLAQDAFGRTTTSGWGTADQGGAWTLTDGPTRYKVTGGVGQISVPTPGTGPGAILGSVSSTSIDSQVELAVDPRPSGGGAHLWLLGRGTLSNGYRERVTVSGTGAVTLNVSRWSGGAETVLQSVSVPAITYADGDSLTLRMQVEGTSPTTVRAKVWRTGTTEPATWQLTATDSTAALQTAGGVGVQTYVSGAATNAPITLSVDNLVARSIG